MSNLCSCHSSHSRVGCTGESHKLCGEINVFVSYQCWVAEPILDVGGCSDGSASSLGRSPFTKQRSLKCMGNANSKSPSTGAEGAK